MVATSQGDTERRGEILDAGMAVLIKKGWKATSMLAIAKASNASKETLYSWFGDKTGFFEALIRRNAAYLDQSVSDEMSVEEGLVSFGYALLTLLMGDASVALNRVAIAEAGQSGTFGEMLIEQGRETSMPVLRGFLRYHSKAGRLDIVDFARAGEDYLGLLKGDMQISRLLGSMDLPDDAVLKAKSERAARNFMKLYGTSRG